MLVNIIVLIVVYAVPYLWLIHFNSDVENWPDGQTVWIIKAIYIPLTFAYITLFLTLFQVLQLTIVIPQYWSVAGESPYFNAPGAGTFSNMWQVILSTVVTVFQLFIMHAFIGVIGAFIGMAFEGNSEEGKRNIDSGGAEVGAITGLILFIIALFLVGPAN
jgi:hypothetical protein